MEGKKDSLSLEQIQEESAKPHFKGSMCPLSPASIEAYQSLGIDPETLRHYPMDFFMKKHANRSDLAEIEYKHCESRRKEAFANLISKRDFIRERNSRTSFQDAAKGEASRLDEMMSSMAAREEHRMEMARRQREKEIQMMRTMELMRKQSQEKFQKNCASSRRGKWRKIKKESLWKSQERGTKHNN